MKQNKPDTAKQVPRVLFHVWKQKENDLKIQEEVLGKRKGSRGGMKGTERVGSRAGGEDSSTLQTHGNATAKPTHLYN